MVRLQAPHLQDRVHHLRVVQVLLLVEVLVVPQVPLLLEDLLAVRAHRHRIVPVLLQVEGLVHHRAHHQVEDLPVAPVPPRVVDHLPVLVLLPRVVLVPHQVVGLLDRQVLDPVIVLPVILVPLLRAAPVHCRVEVLPQVQVPLLRAAQVEALVLPQAHLHRAVLPAVPLPDQAVLLLLHLATAHQEAQVSLQVPVSTPVTPLLRILQ